jgi:hypothetical protein
MAKRKAQKRKPASSSGRKRTRKTSSTTRAARKAPKTKARARSSAKSRPPVASRRTPPSAPPRKATRAAARPKPARAAARPQATRLDRVRRRLDETVPMPPSSLDMKRRGTAARSGRAETAQTKAEHRGMSSAITGGDVDVDLENAYFTGDEAPGGDNTTPDQDVVDDIGRALGVEYQDNEELKGVDKVEGRDRKRWELDPASAEDYKDRK